MNEIRKFITSYGRKKGWEYAVGRDGDVFLDDFRKAFDVSDDKMDRLRAAVTYRDGQAIVNVTEIEDIMWG